MFVTAMMFYTGCGYFVVSMGLNLAIQCGIVPRAGLHYSGVRRVAPSGASLPQKLSEIIAPMSGAGAAHTHTPRRGGNVSSVVIFAPTRRRPAILVVPAA